MKKLIKCGKLFRAVDESVEENVGIIINKNIIEAVVPLNNLVNTENFEVIDLLDSFVMPGLIDTHVHCTLNGEASTAEEEYSMSAAYFSLIGLPIVQADLMAGFTTIRDMGSAGFSDIALRDTINQGIHWGPRIFAGGLPLNTLGGAGDTSFQPPYQGGKANYIRAVVCGPDEARQAARFNFKYGADHVKLLATSAVLGNSIKAGPQELTYEEMRAAVEVAEFLDKPSAAHCIGNKGLKAAIRAGVTSVEHGTFMDEEAADMMLERGTFLVPTLLAVERIMENINSGTIPEFQLRKAKECEKARSNTFKIALKKGLKIAFGTDAATPYNKHGDQAHEFQLMVREGMEPAKALISATRTAAELLRYEDKIGTIEPGKFADIISTKGNPIKDISTLEKVSFVMKDGVVYKSN